MSKLYIKKMLEEYKECNSARFHMPGHKGTVNPYDITEISVTDDLNNPESYILDAERALSKSYQSTHSFFAVNGSTSSIHAMLKYASLNSSYPILISRNSHKSILQGCMIFNIDTIIIEDEYDDDFQAFTYNEHKVIYSIENNKLSAVVITSVDYFGRTIDISRISKLCKEKDILLLCDEAHGAHFHISDLMPVSSLPFADICVHSPHKTLSALTQCSYVHVSDKIDLEKFKSILHSLQTSSPSFLLIQSMDNARYSFDIMKEDWENRVQTAKILRNKLNSIDGINVVGESWTQNCGYYQKDPTRLVVDVSKIGNGINIGKVLENKHKIFMEMYSFKYIVGILTPWDIKEWDSMLYNALLEISNEKCNTYKIPNYPHNHTKEISCIDAQRLSWEAVPLDDSVGKVSATSVGVYPPGVPLILPGEVISKEIIGYMLEVKRLGGSLFGVNNRYINCLKGEH